ncbi:MAG: helix-turn-helix domain-containing protein, partial [Erysipelotrichaceae bacterium]|nr:helix-turn-helix domain-containing protein [Erysipelotrichaceae bacterium]
MIQHKGYKFRIYPNEVQTALLLRFFGCCRFVYNRCLSYRKEVYTLEKRNVSQ